MIAIQESVFNIYGGLAVFIILCLTIFQKEFSSLGFSIPDTAEHWFSRWNDSLDNQCN